MKNFKILSILLLLSMTLCFMGCGGGSQDIVVLKQSDIFSCITRSVVNGSLNMPSTSSGMKIAVQDYALPENTEVTIVERSFPTDSAYSKLTNSDRIFEVKAVIVDNANKAVDLLEKPMVVILPNTMRANVKNYYVGIRENENSEWSFTQVNDKNSSDSPQYFSFLRASSSNTEFYFITNKMGFQTALFAEMENDYDLNKMTVLEGFDFTILAENATDTSKIGYVDIINGIYGANLCAKLRLFGKNLTGLMSSDYTVSLTFFNKTNKKSNKRIFGNSAIISEPVLSNVLADEYVHTVTIGDLKLSGDVLSFDLNTMGFSTTDLPQSFVLSVRDSRRNRNVLPFEYAEFVELKNSYTGSDKPAQEDDPKKDPEKDPDEPEPDPARIATPRNLIVSHTRISTQGNAVISWDSGNPAIQDMTYDVMLAFGNASESVIATGLSDTIYTISGKEKPFEIGTYSVRVVARSSDGARLSTGKIYFSTVDITLEEPVIEPLKPFYMVGEDVKIAWSSVSDPLGVPVVYSVWIWNENEGIHSSADYLGYEPTYTAVNLATGTYKIKVIATNGSNEVESGTIGKFNVVTTSSTSVYVDKSYIAPNGLYSRETKINIIFSETNFDEAAACAAVSVEGYDSSKITKTFNKNWMTLSFDELLEPNKQYTVTMAPMKDIYDLDISTFGSYRFKTFAFAGNGTENEPYILPENPYPTDVIPNALLSLVGSISVDVFDISSAFKGMQICNGASLISNGEVKWSNITPVEDGDTIILGIGNTAFWNKNEKLLLKARFTALHNGNTIWFETPEIALTVEDGTQITAGEGTKEKPFLVYTPNQLDRVRDNLDAYYKQLRDIDLAGFNSEGNPDGWTPIGDYAEGGTYDNIFTGSYDGCNHVIANLRVISENYCSGLFGAVGGKSENNFRASIIDNIILKDCYLANTHPDSESTNDSPGHGLLVGYATNNTQINNCIVNGDLSAKSGSVGGIAGYVYGKYHSCLFKDNNFKGTVTRKAELCEGYSTVGGCIGSAYNVTISNCSVEASLSDNTDIEHENISNTWSIGVGGLVGFHCYGFITDCNTKIQALKGLYNVGGLFGYVDCVDIDACEAECRRIEGGYYNAGGLGGGGYANISNSKASCISIESQNNVGGFLGYSAGDILECHSSVSEYLKATTDVRQSGCVGGFIASCWNTCVNCSAETGDIICNAEFAGGFVGNFEGSCEEYPYHIEDCSSKCNSITARSWSGGFAGNVSGWGHIMNCHSIITGDITVDKLVGITYMGQTYRDTSRAGGFAGEVSSQYRICSCWTKFNNISGTADYVGGFAGEVNYVNISNCYAECSNVSGSQNTGGFIGSGTIFVNNCYTTASVTTSESSTGQFAGCANERSEVNNCFTLNKSSGLPAVGLDRAVTTTVLTDSNGYSDSLGWDGDVYWDLTNTSSPVLPKLKHSPSFNFEDYPTPSWEY